jgi:hypothetical protein
LDNQIFRLMLDSYGVLCGLTGKEFAVPSLRLRALSGDGRLPHLHFSSLFPHPHSRALQAPCCVKCLESFLDERSYIMGSPSGKYSSNLIFLLLQGSLRTETPTKGRGENNTVKESSERVLESQCCKPSSSIQ